MSTVAGVLPKLNREIGYIEPGSDFLKSVVAAFAENAETVRRSGSVRSKGGRGDRYPEVAESEAIGILYDVERPGSLLPRFHARYKKLWDDLQPLRLKLKDFFGPGYIARCMIVRLAPGGRVMSHFDPGWGFSFPHRVHWVLSTNEQSYFYVKEDCYHFGIGQIVEIDNKQEHSATNCGLVDRVHVIIDYLRANDCIAQYCRPVDDAKEAQILTYWFRQERKIGEKGR